MADNITFYKEKEFKDTDIGKIPKEWEVVKLGTILNLKNGERPKISEIRNIPVYGANGIMGYTTKFLADNDFTIVIGRVGASGEIHLGKGKIWISDNAIYSENYNKLKAYLPFLFYLLKFKRLIQFASKTTHPIITQTFLNNFLIPSPELPEQQQIALILSTIDEAIQKTDEVTTKTERLKKGMINELLTKGIGHKEFKDTEIGRIPKEWEVVSLQNVVNVNPESLDPTIKWPDKEFDYVDIEAVKGGRIAATRKIMGKDAPSRARRVIREKDVIMSTVRPYLKAFAPVTRKYDGYICSTGFAVLRPTKRVDYIYLFYTILSERMIKQCNAMMRGGQYPALNQSQVERLVIPLSKPPEQQQIAEILSTIDKKLELTKAERSKLERIKQGFMDILLNGKVRIKVD